MQIWRRRMWIGAFLLFAATTALLTCEPVAHAGDQPSEAQILNALKSRGATRTFGATRSFNDARGAEERRFIDSLRTRSARSLTIVEREKIADIARERPHIDLEITFEFNSAEVGARAVPVLLALGRALTSEELKGTAFLINGHTDAKGSAEYNQDLSERRAEAVKRVLIEQFGLSAGSLVAVGYGKTLLKNTADPYAGENRRVQIVNTEVKASATGQ